MNAPFLIGKPRTHGGGQRSWRAKLYAPDANSHQWIIRFKSNETGQWKWTTRNADDETEAREIFAATEKYLDGADHAPPRAADAAKRTIAALGDEYIDDSRSRSRAVRTIEGRESKLRRHIRPIIGDVPAAEWRLGHSRAVIDHARKTIHSAAGLQDVRSMLSAMRKLAWRLGWLSRSIDPLDGLELPRASSQHGSPKYVPPRKRPLTHQVDAMARAADLLTGTGRCADLQAVTPLPTLVRLPLFGEKIRLAGYGGLRLGEQHALRAIDIDFERGVVKVNGSWTQPRTEDAPAFRGPVKNRRDHDVPVPKSWLDRMLPRAAVALGLPATASRQQVINAQQDEIERRERLAAAAPGHDLTCWTWPGNTPEAWKSYDAKSECWLFVDTATGVPPRVELHNDRWHKVRRWVDANDPEHAWPKRIVYRNLRHHAACFWAFVLNKEWIDVAAFLGDELDTVLGHYVLSSDDALDETIRQLWEY